ncbi:MAG: iron-sulfur cluster assembly protein [Planctomycetes bacterium]|nr:iron-sulfur cluster assembly protein [Planctomycetota bacterium]
MERVTMTSIEETAWDCLRSMKDPDSHRDIVEIGLVQGVQVSGQDVTVSLAPPIKEAFRHEALAAAIRRRMSEVEAIGNVKVIWPKPGKGDRNKGNHTGVSLSLPILDNPDAEIPFETDPMDPNFRRFNIAPEMGYGEGGPEPLPSPEMSIPGDRYEGWPPVLQWEIDPGDPSLESGEEHVRIEDWEYEIWWQAHPADLVYASIQALADDTVTNGPERKHPMGRNVVVNIVFDRRREAVIAVYGTARDFRTFIEAFRIGFGLEQSDKESNE